MMHRPLLAALALCGSGLSPVAHAQETPPTVGEGSFEIIGQRAPKPEMAPRLPAFDLQTQVFDFPTGLRIMFQHDDSYPVVSVYMIVDHGSSEDPPGKDEVAHFVEHTWFRSVHGELPPIMDVVNDISGVFNASTWNDWTNYSTVANADYLPIMMRLESLRLTEFYKGMTEELTKTEREVIRNEWRRRNENNSALLFDYLYNVLYPEGHPYHGSSTHDTIDHIELADLQAYVDQNYKPSETTIMVVGDFEPREAASLIFANMDPKILDPRLTDDMFYQVPKPWDTTAPLTLAYDPEQYARGNKVPYKFPKPDARKPRIAFKVDDRPVPALGSKEVKVEKAPIEKPVAVIGWSLPGGYRPNHLEMVMLGNIANGVIFGNLRQVLPNEVNYNESGCFAQAEVENTTIMCIAEVKDKNTKPTDVIEKMLDQVYLLSDAELAQQLELEFSRARQEFLAQELQSMDTIATIFSGRADNIGTWAHLTGDPNYYTRSIQQVMNVRPESMRQMAEKYLRRDRAARLVVEPLPEDDVDKTSSSSGYIGASAGDDVARTSDDMSKVTKEEIAGARVSIDTKAIVDTTLSNGLRVVVLPHGNVPLVQASLIFGGGPSTLRQGEFEFATSNIIGAGTDPLQVAGQVSWVFIPGFAGLFPSESYPALTGASWSNAWRMDFAAPSGNLDSALWNMRTELDAMKPYLDGAGMWKSKLEKRLKGNWGDKSWHMSHIASEHLYPNAPGHQGWTWDEVQTAEGFNGSTVSDFITHHIDPTNATLVIVGNVDAKTATGLAQGHFGDWQGKDASKPGWQGKLTMPEMPTAPFRVIIEDDPKKTQTQTDMTCRLNTVDERDRPAVAVLGSLLFNQVFTQLRVKEALSYTPVAYAGMSDDNSATLTFSSLALNKGIGRTLQFFMEAAKSVESGTFDREELTLHKLRMARESGLNSQSIGQVVDTLTGPIRRAEGWDRISGAGWDIANVDDTTLIRLIKGCTEHAIVTMTGPKDVIAQQLDGLGIAYEVIDAEKLELELLQKYDEKAYEAKLKAKAKADKKKAKEDAKKAAEEAKPEATPEAAPADAPPEGDLPAPAPSGGDAAPQVALPLRDDEG